MRNRDLFTRGVLLFVLAIAASCGGGGGGSATKSEDDKKTEAVDDEDKGSQPAEEEADPDDDKAAEEPPAPTGPPRAVTFARGLERPWGLAFLPDGSLLVTERPGRLRRVSADGATVSDPIAGLPAITPLGQGGLLDVALDPDFETNRRVYFSWVSRGDAGAGVVVSHGRLAADAGSLTDVQDVFRSNTLYERDFNFGARIAFDRSGGYLYVTLGEVGDSEAAQDPRSDLGKVVRVALASGKSAVWSLGHRNPQGAAIHPSTGELWMVEHGPQGGDEVNIIRKGRNYGWPHISYGCEYGTPPATCTPVGGASKGTGYEQPLTYWTPSTAPSGMAFYTGSKFPEWKGDLFVGALRGMALWHLDLDGNKVKSREPLFESVGDRIRDVRQGPDGWLYLLTDSDQGRIVRIER